MALNDCEVWLGQRYSWDIQRYIVVSEGNEGRSYFTPPWQALLVNDWTTCREGRESLLSENKEGDLYFKNSIAPFTTSYILDTNEKH